eukprot:scaffold34425_cov35-Tisochrysis_lutea.AAC.1
MMILAPSPISASLGLIDHNRCLARNDFMAQQTCTYTARVEREGARGHRARLTLLFGQAAA